jgi:DNA-binding response OmpR family regulator
MKTILIIEDESELVKILKAYLEESGFKVLTAYRGDTGFRSWEQNQPDLVLLDLNLPVMDGIDIAREIRRKSDTPIIMLTARVGEADRLIGLELGADDYILKPFSPREVVARVRAVLRRSGQTATSNAVLHAADLEIDKDAHLVTRKGQVIDLTPMEFNLLVELASQPGRTFTRLQLLEATQGNTFEGYQRTIDAHIKNLRAKIELDPRKPRYIETVFGVGYRFFKDTK